MRLALISAILISVALAGPAAAGRTAHTSGEPKAHAIEKPAPAGLTGLLHASPDRVKARLGEPTIARAEGKGAFWTYQASHCALYIFFREEGGLRVSGAAAGPRTRGVAAPDLRTCMAELERSELAGPAQ